MPNILRYALLLLLPSLAQAQTDEPALDSINEALTQANTRISRQNDSLLEAFSMEAYGTGMQPDTARWAALTADPAFYYRNMKEQQPPPAEKNNHNTLGRLMRAILSFFGTAAGRFLFWSAMLAILLYALYRALGGELASLLARRRRRFESKGQQPADEAGLLETDWEAQMRQAATKGDLRMAVRFGYLSLLQLLQDRGLIQYRQDKTNLDYHAELSQTPYQQAFRRMTRQYEYAWYGHFELSTQAYNNYLETFSQIKKQVHAS